MELLIIIGVSVRWRNKAPLVVLLWKFKNIYLYENGMFRVELDVYKTFLRKYKES